MLLRYQIRPDRSGFSVYDVWTGEAAVIAMDPQTGLTRDDAIDIADLLNRRARQGDASVLQ